MQVFLNPSLEQPRPTQTLSSLQSEELSDSMIPILNFPLIWVAFTIVRGSITGWWPYWFLDPTGAGGVGSMLMYIFGIMFLLVFGASFVLGLQRLASRLRR